MASNVPTLNNFKLPTLNNNPPSSRQFSRDEMLLKKPSKGKCLLNKLLDLNRGCLGVHFPKTSYFHDKTKSSKANLRVHYLILKMLRKAMYFDFLDFGQVTKLNPEIQDFKRVLDLT